MSVVIIEEMLGKTIIEIRGEQGDEILLFLSTTECFKFHHVPDCCETVYINDIVGDINDILDEPLLVAEWVTSNNSATDDTQYESHTWTFYKFATRKGSISIKWLGESNGYYSESVDYEYFQVDPSLNLEVSFNIHEDNDMTWDAAKLYAFTAMIAGEIGWRLPSEIEWNTASISDQLIPECWLSEPNTVMYSDHESYNFSNLPAHTARLALVRDV